MEREFHRWLSSRLQPKPGVLLGIGDDAAVLKFGDSQLVVTTDTIAEGTHFISSEHPLEVIGRKSLAVSLSDIAAMGAKPIAAVLQFQLPKTLTLHDAQKIFSGIETLARNHEVAIVGGDTNSWDGPLLLGSTVLGTLPAGQPAWSMDRARPGDAIFVSGRFGGSILGHHLAFEPAVDLANALAAGGAVSAATDVTDSLSSDLAALAAASGYGAQLKLEQVPISDAAFELARREVGSSADEAQIRSRALEHALIDGEDFGLILAVPEANLGKLTEADLAAHAITRIGTFCAEEGLWACRANGDRDRITVQGYDH